MSFLQHLINRIRAFTAPAGHVDADRTQKVRVGFAVATLAVCALLLSTATAQPSRPPAAAAAKPSPAKPSPAKPSPARPSPAKPSHGGLPNWHPPVGAAPGARNHANANARRQLDALRQASKERRGTARAPATRKAPKYPVDEHGHCVGDGPNDIPRPINLVHGWLGGKGAYGEEGDFFSPQRPPRLTPRTDDMSWGDALTRQVPYWKWRLTPYPYRFDNHDDHCDPKNQPVPLLANIINVAVLFLLIRRFGRKPLIDALKNRKKSIMGEIDRARAIRKSAAERLDKYQDELDNLDSKLTGLREQYQAEGETEEKRLVADMGETRDRMMEDASFRITQESKAARDTLTRQALRDALSAAEALLLERVTKADHQRLADEYLEQIAAVLSSQYGDEENA